MDKRKKTVQDDSDFDKVIRRWEREMQKNGASGDVTGAGRYEASRVDLDATKDEMLKAFNRGMATKARGLQLEEGYGAGERNRHQRATREMLTSTPEYKAMDALYGKVLGTDDLIKKVAGIREENEYSNLSDSMDQYMAADKINAPPLESWGDAAISGLKNVPASGLAGLTVPLSAIDYASEKLLGTQPFNPMTRAENSLRTLFGQGPRPIRPESRFDTMELSAEVIPQVVGGWPALMKKAGAGLGNAAHNIEGGAMRAVDRMLDPALSRHFMPTEAATDALPWSTTIGGKPYSPSSHKTFLNDEMFRNAMRGVAAKSPYSTRGQGSWVGADGRLQSNPLYVTEMPRGGLNSVAARVSLDILGQDALGLYSVRPATFERTANAMGYPRPSRQDIVSLGERFGDRAVIADNPELGLIAHGFGPNEHAPAEVLSAIQDMTGQGIPLKMQRQFLERKSRPAMPEGVVAPRWLE